MSDSPETVRRDRPSLVWPILLIALGVILLLANLNLLPGDSLALLLRLWPVAVILLGLDLIIGRRSTAGMLISGCIALLLVGGLIVLLLLAPQIPALSQLTAGAELRTEHISAPLGPVETARVTMDWGGNDGTLRAAPASSQNLIEGDVSYFGSLIFDVSSRGQQSTVRLDTRSNSFGFFNIAAAGEREWNLALHPGVTYDLYLDTGSGAPEFDLSELTLNELRLDSGSGSISLALPPGDYKAVIDAGSGAVDITLPAGSAVRVEVDSGSGRFSAPGELELVMGEADDDGIWETPGYAQAAEKIELEIDQGSGSVRVDFR